MTQSQSGVQVNNLQTVSTLSNTASILVLTDAVNNNVGLIDKNNLASSLVSTTSGNGLTVDSNGLKVPNIGTLANLTTADKTSIVNAINSLNAVTTLTTSGTIALTDNSINSITPTGAVTFTLPTVTDNTTFHQILVQVNLTNTSYIDGTQLGTTHYFNLSAPSFPQTGNYNIYFEYDATDDNWYVGNIIKGVQA